ncbi:MAG TPA: hypothetical protein VGU69_01785 [Rhizomicrobium sp.]|nr:hypothetical protein [Rhizomicrobium sp.]
MSDHESGAKNAPRERNSAMTKAQSHFAAAEARTTLVKTMMSAESAAQDAKTIKLKALRLAKEAADREAAAAAPPPAPKKKAKASSKTP